MRACIFVFEMSSPKIFAFPADGKIRLIKILIVVVFRRADDRAGGDNVRFDASVKGRPVIAVSRQIFQAAFIRRAVRRANHDVVFGRVGDLVIAQTVIACGK